MLGLQHEHEYMKQEFTEISDAIMSHSGYSLPYKIFFLNFYLF